MNEVDGVKTLAPVILGSLDGVAAELIADTANSSENSEHFWADLTDILEKVVSRMIANINARLDESNARLDEISALLDELLLTQEAILVRNGELLAQLCDIEALLSVDLVSDVACCNSTAVPRPPRMEGVERVEGKGHKRRARASFDKERGGHGR